MALRSISFEMPQRKKKKKTYASENSVVVFIYYYFFGAFLVSQKTRNDEVKCKRHPCSGSLQVSKKD
jgi:hypothetical protein